MELAWMASAWADDGQAEEQEEAEYAEGGAEVQAPPPVEEVESGGLSDFDDSWADNYDRRAQPATESDGAEDGKVLFADSWADEAPSVAQEALQLLQLLGEGSAGHAAPSDARPGRPTGRTGTHSTLVDLGWVGGVDYGGAAPMLGAAFPPRKSFFFLA